MPDPLRREADAFRMVVAFAAGAAIVIAVTVATRPVYGVVTAAALLGFGAGKLWSDARHRRSVAALRRRGEADDAGPQPPEPAGASEAG